MVVVLLFISLLASDGCTRTHDSHKTHSSGNSRRDDDRRGKDGTGQSVTHRQRVRRRDGFMCVGWDIKSEIRKQTKADDRISVPY